MAPIIEPSAVITRVLNTVQTRGEGFTRELALTRVDSYPSELEAELSGIAMNPSSRSTADRVMEAAWLRDGPRSVLLNNSGVGTVNTRTVGEVIIGSGYHAAVYAATRGRMGFPKPIVLESASPTRVGGAFAVTQRPSFWLNSRNRPGGPGIAGDSRASLNYIPGGIVQPAGIGMREFQSNADMAFCIRATLAQYAIVVPRTRVLGAVLNADINANGMTVSVDNDGDTFDFDASRVIDARGLGQPNYTSESPYIITFNDLLQRAVEQVFPFAGLKRVAVVGGGDAAKCAVETFLGLAPEPFMSPVGVDHVERIDWYGPNIPNRCKDWTRVENDRGEQVRGRYRAIGHYLRRDAYGLRKLNIINESVAPAPFVNGAIIQDTVYDLVVMCTGNQLPALTDGVDGAFLQTVLNSSGSPIATVFANRYFRVGPVAAIPFTRNELENGVADFAQNQVSMFRTGKMTASLAVKLPGVVL